MTNITDYVLGNLEPRVAALEQIEVPSVGGGGGAIGGTIAATQIAYGTAANTIGGDADLTYTAATNTINIDNIQFDLTPTPTAPSEGLMCWNATDGTVNIGMPGGNVNLQVGQESIARVKAGEDILNGQVVYVSNVTGANLIVSLARADDPATCHPRSIYMATEDIANNQHGYVTRWGNVRDVDTSVDSEGHALSDNDVLYLSATVAGGFTNVAPEAPNILVKIGGVIKADATVGIISFVTYLGGILTDVREGWYLQNAGSAGRLWGGIITDAGGGTVNISAGAGVVKNEASDLETEPTAIDQGQGSGWTMVEWTAQAGFALVGVGYNIIYWDASAGAFAVQLQADFYANFDFTRDFTIGRVYYDGVNVTIRICGMNLWNFNRRVQMFGEERFPVERATGMMISATGTRNIALTAGVIWAELVNRFSVNAFDSSGAGRFTYWYRNGLGGWTSVATQAQIDNTYWDDNTGTLNDLTANRYGVHWVYEVHDSSVHVVYGQGDYTLTQSEQASPPATLPGLLAAYATLVGKIVIQKTAAAFTSIQSPFTTQFAPGAVSNHNDLSGLQGGTTNEYYHLTSAQHTGLTTGTPTRIAQFNAGPVLGDSTLIKTGAGVLTLSAGGAYTLTVPATGTAALGAGTLTVTSTNDVTGATHTHAVTTTNDGDTNVSTILASGAAGDLRIDRLGVGVAVIAASGTVALPDGGYIGVASDVRTLYDATNGRIDLILGDAAGADEVRVVDSVGTAVATVDSDGTAVCAVIDMSGGAASGQFIKLDTLSIAESSTGITFYSGFYRTGGQPVFTMIRSGANLSLMGSGVDGDTERRFVISAAGVILWGDGSSGRDTNLYRNGANQLRTDDMFICNQCLIGTTTDGMTASGSLAIAQDLAHRGAYVGFYNTTPIVKPTVTGSRGGNAALASFITAIANLGLITDSTSA